MLDPKLHGAISIRVNGNQERIEVENRTLLIELLREKLELTGAHVGCDTGQCSSCVVHLNGRSVEADNVSG